VEQRCRGLSAVCWSLLRVQQEDWRRTSTFWAANRPYPAPGVARPSTRQEFMPCTWSQEIRSCQPGCKVAIPQIKELVSKGSRTRNTREREIGFCGQSDVGAAVAGIAWVAGTWMYAGDLGKSQVYEWRQVCGSRLRGPDSCRSRSGARDDDVCDCVWLLPLDLIIALV
jgi:hypothetical protein